MAAANDRAGRLCEVARAIEGISLYGMEVTFHYQHRDLGNRRDTYTWTAIPGSADVGEGYWRWHGPGSRHDEVEDPGAPIAPGLRSKDV